MVPKDPQTDQILALARGFKEPKEISMTVHLPIRVVQTRLALHGYHRYYITDAERRLLLRRRQKEVVG